MATDGESELFKESGIVLRVPNATKTIDRLKTFNPKYAVFREITLATLKIEVNNSQSSQYFCFDVHSGTGVAGLQWKKHLGDKVTVTCGDRSDGWVKNTCMLNNLKVTNWNGIEGSQRDTPTQQAADCIYVSTLQPKILLHAEAFDFIYLHIHSNISSYIDSVFTNIRTDGVACLLFPNIASQCFRSPKLIQRQFYAYTQKTVYVTEMAARIVIADIARTAGRHGRAMDVLYTLYTLDQFFIVVKIKKGSQMAFNSVDKCRPILHCLMCEERVIYPDSHCPVDWSKLKEVADDNEYQIQYDMKPSNVVENIVEKEEILKDKFTAMIGSIYNMPYLNKLENRLKNDFPKSSGLALLDTVITEAICDQSLYSCKASSHSKNGNSKSGRQLLDCSNEPASKRQKLDNNTEQAGAVNDRSKSHVTNRSDESVNGTGTDGGYKQYDDMPLFYYHLHQQRYSIVPRCDVVVARLKEAGYRASRTHFEPHSIRTNATLKQMQTIIETTTKQKQRE